MEIVTKTAEDVMDRALKIALDKLKPGMTRRERRAWYRSNRKRLGLPSWGELQNIKAI